MKTIDQMGLTDQDLQDGVDVLATIFFSIGLIGAFLVTLTLLFPL